MIKKLLVCTIILVISIAPMTIAGSFGIASGNIATADACGFGIGHFGGIVGLGDKFTSFIGTLNYGFSQYTEGRVKFGFSDADGVDATILIGADLKYEYLDYYDANRPAPFDLAFGGFFEWADYDNASLLQIGGNIIGSIPYRFNGGQRLIPYGRVNLRLERVSARGNSDSNLELGINFGTKFELSGDLAFYGEIQVDGNTGLFLGTELRAF